jgi:uncharacterized protein (TIGR02145 family)
MKLFSIIAAVFLTLFAVAISYAQPMTVRATVSAGSTVNNVYAAFGQPFYQQILTGGMELAYGVAQAQLDVVEVADETCENVAYSDNGFDIPTSELTVGTMDYERYTNDTPPYGYDHVTKLALSVWPTYTTEANASYHGALPLIPGSELQDGTDYQVHEGVNVINYSSAHHCDSVVTLNVYYCPLTVKDADSILYNTVLLGNYCWTQSNLKTTHYFGDGHEEVPMALIYSPGEDVNEGIYGRLYTWYSAVNIPEGSTAVPPVDGDGFVRGICPAGWHLPANPEVEALEEHATVELNTPTLWITGAGLNTSGFTLLPAGIYSSILSRFQGLGTETRIWRIAGIDNSDPASFCTVYYCDEFVTVTATAADAYSVRCVKNY